MSRLFARVLKQINSDDLIAIHARLSQIHSP